MKNKHKEAGVGPYFKQNLEVTDGVSDPTGQLIGCQETFGLGPIGPMEVSEKMKWLTHFSRSLRVGSVACGTRWPRLNPSSLLMFSLIRYKVVKGKKTETVPIKKLFNVSALSLEIVRLPWLW